MNKHQFSKNPKKSSTSIPKTRLDEETVAEDTRTYFQEIIKNTKMTTIQEQVQKEKDSNRKPSLVL